MMMRYSGFAALAVLMLGLGACSGSQSVGFTGLGGEPVAVTRQAPVTQTLDTDYATAGTVPNIKLAASAADPKSRTALAIEAGGTTLGRYAPVFLGGQSLGLSVVEIDRQHFAVLRATQQDPKARLNQRTAQALSANATIMTGCLAKGSVVTGGRMRMRAAGQAIALDCR